MSTIVIVHKSSSEESGLFLYKDIEGRIIVNEIQNGGIFENTNLRSSMHIVSVNGTSCNDLDEHTVKEMINEADGEVIIEVEELIYDAVVVEDGNGAQEGFSDNVPFTATAVEMQPISEAEQIHSNLIFRGGDGGESGNHVYELVDQRRPPEGLPEGGEWALVKYSGGNTLMLCLALAFFTGILSCCGTCAFLCPQDKRRVYIINDKVGPLKQFWIQTYFGSFVTN